jgi:hypothetical protein
MSFGLYLLLNIVLILFLGLWLRGLVVRRLQPQRVLADLEEEIHGIMSELNQTSDHNISILEDRIAQLRTVVHQADSQIEELEMRISHLREGYPSPEVPQRNDFRSPDAGEDSVFPLQFGERQEENQNGPAVSPVSSNDDDPGVDEASQLSVRDQVLRFHRQGLSGEIIANRTGVAVGEVELIISLGEGRAHR